MSYGPEKRQSERKRAQKRAKQAIAATGIRKTIYLGLRLSVAQVNDLESICDWLRRQSLGCVKITHTDGVVTALTALVEGLGLRAESNQRTAGALACAEQPTANRDAGGRGNLYTGNTAIVVDTRHAPG